MTDTQSTKSPQMSQHDTLTLEPCPFCGRHVEHVSRADNHSATGKTYIVSCFCGGYSACAHQQEDTLEEVVAAWNRRAALSATQPAQAHWTEREPVRLALSRVGRVYIAGPMTGIEEFNFPAFNAEADKLRGEGLAVLNPAEHGIVDGAEWADYLRHDIAGLTSCERIHLLRGWSNSKGAQLEVTIGKALGMAITYQDGAEEAQAAQQPEAVPSGLHEKDIYDFAGWLTSRPGVMEVGCTSWACPMADAVVEYIKTFPERFAPAQQPAGDVVRDAERWRYALESDDFAVCKWETIFGEEGWFPISETSEIDAAIDSARKGE